MLPAAPSVGDQPQDDVAVALAWAAERRQAIERLGVEIRGLGWSGLRRSRLSCGQNVSNAAGGASKTSAIVRRHAIRSARRARDGR